MMTHATIHKGRAASDLLTFVAASKVLRTSLLKGMLSVVLSGFLLPDSISTAAFARSIVMPLLR